MISRTEEVRHTAHGNRPPATHRLRARSRIRVSENCSLTESAIRPLISLERVDPLRDEVSRASDPALLKKLNRPAFVDPAELQQLEGRADAQMLAVELAIW